MIELTGLSPLQRELAERMWNMESMDEIVAWVQTMPRSVALQAYIVMQMIIAAEIDRQAEDDVSAAEAIIERIRSC
jgi:transcription termination factor Rho